MTNPSAEKEFQIEVVTTANERLVRLVSATSLRSARGEAKREVMAEGKTVLSTRPIHGSSGSGSKVRFSLAKSKWPLDSPSLNLMIRISGMYAAFELL